MASLTVEDFTEQAQRIVKKELHTRQRILGTYNKTRIDFPEGIEGDTLYDEYLEEIEDMIEVLLLPNTSTTVQERRDRVQRKLKAEKRNTLNEAGHRNEEREE